MRNPDRQTTFRFKQFTVSNCLSAMKIGTDSVLLGAWAFSTIEPAQQDGLKILDIGSGTGVLSLMMAQRFPHAIVTAVEIDPLANSEAMLNFRNSPWTCRMESLQADFLQWAPAESPASYQFIVSNPPFFAGGASAPDAARHTARHQDSLPLERLFAEAARLLARQGRMAIVLPYDRAGDARFAAALAGLEPAEECTVSTAAAKQPKRIMMELRHTVDHDGDICRTALAMRMPDGRISPEYRQLVAPFYLHDV